MLQEGKIIRWQDERGFGFIRLSDGGEVFLHISALGQIERRPQLGDEVIFEIEEESNGRRRAANAVIKGGFEPNTHSTSLPVRSNHPTDTA